MDILAKKSHRYYYLMPKFATDLPLKGKINNPWTSSVPAESRFLESLWNRNFQTNNLYFQGLFEPLYHITKSDPRLQPCNQAMRDDRRKYRNLLMLPATCNNFSRREKQTLRHETSFKKTKSRCLNQNPRINTEIHRLNRVFLKFPNVPPEG